MSLVGFPLMRYIDVNDLGAVLRAIKLTDPNRAIDLIVHTPGAWCSPRGGSRALRRHSGKVTVFGFMNLFPQPTRLARPSVEYVPLPYRDGQEQPRSRP
jgi:hypothetical protein